MRKNENLAETTCVNFPSYWQSFVAFVDQNPKLNTVVKLNRLNQSLVGETREVAKLFQFEEDSYGQMKETLLTRYGDEKLCINKMSKDLVVLDKVKPNDVKGLRTHHNKTKQVIYKE